MSDFTLPRITEKKYLAISTTPFTADGTVDGIVTIVNTYCFKVGQCVLLKQGSTHFVVKIKRVISSTQFIVIDKDKSVTTHDKLDISSFLAGTTVELQEVKRPVIDLLEIQRQVYEEEPTIALRSHLVDWLGNSYDPTNPMPVQLSDGSINIGTVNAELEVQLSHQPNVPNAGDVPDSVQIGDGTDILSINPDGSINTKVSGTAALPKTVRIPVALANTETSYTFTTNTKRFKFRVEDSASKAQVAYVATQSSTDFWTVNRGSIYEEKALDLTAGVTIYFQVNKANQVVQIMYWE